MCKLEKNNFLVEIDGNRGNFGDFGVKFEVAVLKA